MSGEKILDSLQRAAEGISPPDLVALTEDEGESLARHLSVTMSFARPVSARELTECLIRSGMRVHGLRVRTGVALPAVRTTWKTVHRGDYTVQTEWPDL